MTTGRGIAFAIILGAALFNEPLGALRLASVLLIVAGLVGLKLAS